MVPMKTRVTVAVLVASVLGAQVAHAQAIQNVVLRNSFNPIGAGARGLGMGGAFIAVADDGTASSFNPAGLAQLRRTEFAAVGFTDLLDSTVRVPATGAEDASFESHVRHQRPDFFGLALPFEVGHHNLTVQVSYQRAVDLFGQGRATVQDTIDLAEIDPDLKGTGDVIADIVPTQSGGFHTVSLSAGYQLTSRLSVGTSLNYWFARWSAQGENTFRLRVHPPGAQRQTEVPLVTTDFHQDQKVRGFNFNAGFLLKYPRLSLGGVVRLPFSGDYDLSENDSEVVFDQGKPQAPRPIDFDVKTRLRWPLSAGVGAALRPLRGLTLAADFTQSHWSRTSIDDVPAGALLTPEKRDVNGNPEDSFTNRNFFDLLPSSQTATGDTSQWRAGGEYLVTFIPKVVVPLRGGIFRDRSPVSELGSSEGRRIKGWTAGTGLNFSHLVLDVAFERRESEGFVSLRLRAGQPVNQATAPRETVREERFVASLVYRFSDNDPLKRALRYLFVGPEEKENP
jgi:long-chain fatty acid transport protein